MKKRIVAMLLIGVMILGSFAGCKKDDPKGSDGVKKETFSVWLGKAEDSQYYSDYAENPVLKSYLGNTYTGADGKEVEVALEFQVPPSGSEKDNLNTLISTGDYTDILDLDYYSGSIVDLYDEGIVIDITKYVEEYMPNYVAFLEKNPELALTATNVVDGEKKYLCIRGYNTYVYQWQGFEYRRDWIVKYGKNPETGAAFTGGYVGQKEDGTVDTTSWEDDVVFPSGGKNPVYISDWEWMFGIFEEALAAEGVTDGYCISLPSMGYSEIGYLNGAFGGSALWYKDRDNNIAFGGNSANMQAYLQCVNTWYKKGWVDKAFAEHTGDLPWRIDEVNVRQGKVGAWVGGDSQLMNKMNTEDPLTKDIVTFSAAYPINDMYGDASTQNIEPYCLYQTSPEGKTFGITDKAEKKDIVALFSLLNTFYDEENAVKNNHGFTKEEYEASQDEFYTKMGLTDGSYYDSGTTTSDGKKLYYWDDKVARDSGNLKSAVAMIRIFSIMGDTPTMAVREKRAPQLQELYDIWDYTYMNTGVISGSFKAQLSAEDAQEFSTIATNVNEFMSRTIPRFIMGENDPFNAGDWEAFSKALEKYNPSRSTEIYQNLLDSLK